MFESSGGNIKKLKLKKGNLLREELLAIKGVGPETADSILLYALGKPVFVVDAYTRRVFERHDLIQADATYNQIQEFFTRYLSGEQNLFNEYHALIVELGKNYCKKLKPRCAECPLSSLKKRKKWSNTQKV